jgi:hypothetical protein
MERITEGGRIPFLHPGQVQPAVSIILSWGPSARWFLTSIYCIRTNYVPDYSAINYPMNYQEAYYVLNGSVTFTHSSGKCNVNAYIKNATNYAAKNFWMNMA